MKTLLLLLLSLHTGAQYVDKVLQPYVTACLAEFRQYGFDLSKLHTIDSITLVSPAIPIKGNPTFDGFAELFRKDGQITGRRIWIHTYKGQGAGEAAYYRYLVHHELGHALFELRHTDSRPAIMNTCSDRTAYGTRNWERLHRRFIHRLKRLSA